MMARKISRFMKLLLIAFLFIPFVHPMQARADFTDTIEQETIHTYSGSGILSYSAFAKSPAGDIYLAYVKAPDEIEILKWDGSGWTAVANVTNTDAETSTVEGALDLAVDADNHLHLVFTIDSMKGIKYGYFDGSDWTFQTLEWSDSSATKRDNPNIAVDSNGKAHVIFRSVNSSSIPINSLLRYASNALNESGYWQVVTAVQTAAPKEWKYHAGIAVDSQNLIYISFYWSGKFYYLSKTAAAENFGSLQEVASNIQNVASVVIDSKDRLHFLYSDTSGDAHLDSLSEGQWERMTLYDGSADRILTPLGLYVYGTKRYTFFLSQSGDDSDFYYFALANDGNQTSIGDQVITSGENYDSEGAFFTDWSGNYIVIVQNDTRSELYSLTGTSVAFGLSLPDTTPPDPPVITSPADGSYTGKKPVYSGTAEEGSTVEVFVDDVSVGTAAANGAGKWTLTQPTDLPEGDHTVTATATDAADNVSGLSSPVNFIVDSTPPDAPVISAPEADALLKAKRPSYSGTAEKGSTVEVFVDGESIGTTAADGVTGAWTLAQPADLDDGTHTVKATAKDAVGNESNLSSPVSFTVDTTPPGAPVIASPAAGAYVKNKKPVYSGTAEAGSTVKVIVDGSSIGTVTADVYGKWTLTQPTDLADETYSVKATATDKAGNESVESVSVSFTVDTTPPDAPVISAPEADALLKAKRPTYSGTAEKGSTVEVFVDGASIGTTAADAVTGAWTLAQPADLDDGTHTVKATATDKAENESAESASVSFTVDVKAPDAPVIASPENGAHVKNKQPVYSGTAEAGSTVKVIVNGSSIGTVTADVYGKWTLTQPTDLSEATHAVKATATDKAGNESGESASVSFTVDVTAPGAPVILNPGNGAHVNAKRPSYSGTAEKGSTVEVFVDGESIGTTTADGNTGIWTLAQPADLSEEDHTVKAKAMDKAGNESADSAPVSFTVDLTAPGAPVISAPDNGAVLKVKRPTYSGTAEAGSKLTVIVDGSSIGTVTADVYGQWTFVQPADLEDGAHLVKAKTEDPAGNVSVESAAVGFTVDTTAPEIAGAEVSANNEYVDVTFSEGIYGTDEGLGAIDKDDLALIFTPGSGGAESVTIYDVRKPDAASAETAGALAGGETVIRVFLTVSGTDNGTGKIEIRPANGASIFDKAGNAASDLATTGQISLNDTTPAPEPPYIPENPDTESPVGQDGLDVYVNGEKIEKIAKAELETINGKKVATVTVDEQTLNARLEAVEPGYVVTIPVHNGSDTLIAELNARMVGNMAAKEAVLEVQNELGAYILPAREVNIEAVLEQLGSGTAPEDVKIRVEMTLLDDSEVEAGSGNLQRVAPAVEFRITAVYGDQEVSIHAFTSYVERMISIPDEVERSRITTGVVMLPNGEMGHVPTKVIENDGSQFALINSLTNSVYSVIYHEKTFSDIRSHWAKAYIENMASRLVLNGKSEDRFDPDENITRAEFAAIVVRALGLHSAVGGGNSFTDVKSTDWYASAVQIAASYRLLEGYADGTFRANAPITREEAMAVIARAMALAGMDTSLSAERQEQLISAFADGGSVSLWARQSAALNIHHGIIQGNGGALNPQSPISRAETAAVIQRLLQQADLIDEKR